jgi:hypothetical protein
MRPNLFAGLLVALLGLSPLAAATAAPVAEAPALAQILGTGACPAPPLSTAEAKPGLAAPSPFFQAINPAFHCTSNPCANCHAEVDCCLAHWCPAPVTFQCREDCQARLRTCMAECGGRG